MSRISHRSYSTSAILQEMSTKSTRARVEMRTLTCRHNVQLLALDFFPEAVEESIMGKFAVQR